MRKSKLSKIIQQRLIEHFVAGTTARCAVGLWRINRNTATNYYQILREIISLQLEKESEEVFKDEIKVDESYFGGARKGKRVGELLAKCPYLGC